MPSARGRPKKTRMDAAIAAMGQYGFPKDKVTQTVNKLLKVYGGDEGWFFIQESCYKLLTETILEDQEEEEVNTKGEAEASAAVQISSFPDETVTGDDARAVEASMQAVVDGETSSHLQALSYAPFADASSGRKDISCTDQVCRNSSQENPLRGQCQHVLAARELSVPINGSQIIGHNVSDQPVVPTPRRKPCYGWLSEEESEEESEVIAGGLHKDRKRKSGWDVRPFGMQNL